MYATTLNIPLHLIHIVLHKECIRYLVYCDIHNDCRPYKLNTHYPYRHHNTTIMRCLFLNSIDEEMRTSPNGYPSRYIQHCYQKLAKYDNIIIYLRQWAPLPEDCMEMSLLVAGKLNTCNQVFILNGAPDCLFSDKRRMKPLTYRDRVTHKYISN